MERNDGGAARLARGDATQTSVPARAEAVSLAERYVAAYNDRDLDAMLAVMGPDVESHPSRLGGARPHQGHAGVRAWWEEMEAAGQVYEVLVSEVRPVGRDRAVVIGEIRDQGQPVSPWCVVVRVSDGLIVESRSYLSESDLLEQLGVISR